MERADAPSHAQFAEALGNGSCRVEFNEKQKHRLLSGPSRYVFYALVLTYLIGPLVVVPVLAHQLGNWWLLLGIAAAYAGALSAARSSSLMALATLMSAIVWFRAGFSLHQYLTFFYFCGLGGYVLYWLADAVEAVLALRSIERNAATYERALRDGSLSVIMVPASE